VKKPFVRLLNQVIDIRLDSRAVRIIIVITIMEKTEAGLERPDI